MTSSPQWRASTPPNEPAGPQTVTEFLLQVSTWFYSKYSNSVTLRTVLVRVWHFTSSLSFLVFSTACLTKVRAWFKECIRCSACHMKISGGLATVVHSCGHFCGEFGAVNVELQNLRLFGPELLRIALYEIGCIIQFMCFGDPSFTSVSQPAKTQCLSQEALLFLGIIMKLYWQVREANLAIFRAGRPGIHCTLGTLPTMSRWWMKANTRLL